MQPASCTCPECGGALRQLGEDASEQLDYVPGYFQVIRHVRPKLACRACARIVQAAAPSRPIERGLPTASPARAGDRREVRRSLPAVPPGRDLSAQWGRAAALDAGRVGR